MMRAGDGVTGVDGGDVDQRLSGAGHGVERRRVAWSMAAASVGIPVCRFIGHGSVD